MGKDIDISLQCIGQKTELRERQLNISIAETFGVVNTVLHTVKYMDKTQQNSIDHSTGTDLSSLG